MEERIHLPKTLYRDQVLCGQVCELWEDRQMKLTAITRTKSYTYINILPWLNQFGFKWEIRLPGGTK